MEAGPERHQIGKIGPQPVRDAADVVLGSRDLRRADYAEQMSLEPSRFRSLLVRAEGRVKGFGQSFAEKRRPFGERRFGDQQLANHLQCAPLAGDHLRQREPGDVGGWSMRRM